MKTPDFKLRADYLLAASHCVSTNPSRPYLSGVHVEPHPSGTGVLMIGTDCHVMAVLHDPEGYAARPATLSMKWRDAQLKSKNKREGSRTLFIPDLHPTVYINQGEVRVFNAPEIYPVNVYEISAGSQTGGAFCHRTTAKTIHGNPA